MERAGLEDLVGTLPKGTSISSKTETSPNGCTPSGEEACPRCGAKRQTVFTPFPPKLAEKYGKGGQTDLLPCTPECERRSELIEWQREVSRSKAARLLEKSEMPERLSRSTLGAFDPAFSEAARRGLDAVRRYLAGWEEYREEGTGLYLCGSVGSGKTHLAAGLARELIAEKHVPTFFHTAPELLDSMRPGSRLPGNHPGSDLEAWGNYAMECELLVLDDLGAEKVTEWARERLFVLVNHRNRRSLPTIYTSNIGPKDLAEHLGERTASRIVETSKFVRVDGPDHRARRRKA